MSRPNFDPVQLARVVERQREGANAHSNAWVSASAGAGKTRVLRDRVLRLLMAGVRPERILCLTFTKAAAAEMSRRISDELGSWTVADDTALHENLEELFGAPQDDAALVQARRLFARVLEAPLLAAGQARAARVLSFPCHRLVDSNLLHALFSSAAWQ